MKIGIDARMYGAQSTTGIGVYVEQLTNALFRLDTENQYYIFLREPIYSKFVVPHSRVTKVKADIPWYGYAEQTRLPLLLRRYRLDLVHFPHFNVPIFYPGRYIVTIHDITPKFFPGPVVKKSLVRRLGYRLTFTTALRRADTIIAISEHTKRNIINNFRVDREKISVIYPGITSGADKEIDSKKIQAIKDKYHIDNDFLLYVGVWRDHKNLPNLIAAFDILRAGHHQSCQLVLAGNSDPRYPEIAAAINNSAFKKDIITPGFVPDEDLSVLYAGAAIFVLPSFCEGFGLVAAEALSYGTPVAASASTSLPEVIGDGGLFFDPHRPGDIAATINTILTDPTRAQQLVIAGKRHIKKYSWSAAATETIALYRR